MGGLPIDVLLRLGVQSINGLHNAVMLAEANAAGSPDFFLLLRDLRRLQIAGLLGIRLRPDTERAASHGNPAFDHAYLSIATTRDPDLQAVAEEAKRLLGMPPAVTEVEVVYGVGLQHGQVVVLSNSMLGVLAQVSLQIDVPPHDVARNLTRPTVGNIGIEQRPVIIIHSGTVAPANAFTSVQYLGTFFWIAVDDFDSKVAFTVLQVLLSLARTEVTPGAIVTIPAR